MQGLSAKTGSKLMYKDNAKQTINANAPLEKLKK
jgi:hypothetical protein